MPTVRDLCRMTKLAIGTVSDHLNILERKGWIKVVGSPRGIHLTEEPTDKVDTVAVLLVGTITAGSPIEALEVPEDPIVLPKAVAKPGSFALLNNYPNPFNPNTTILYALPKETDVKLEVYNLLGQKVRVLVNKHQDAGYQTVVWDGRNDKGESVPTGIYFYRLQAESYVNSKKMILMK